MPSVYRGTTPTVEVHVRGVDLSDASAWPVVWLTLVDKYGSTIDADRKRLGISSEDGGSVASLHLTQAETLSFTEDGQVEAQVRARSSKGEAVASPVMDIDVLGVLKGGEV